MSDLSKLAVPFPADDIEWRVSRAGKCQGDPGIYCNVLAYITARGIQSRLDEVVGPENWRLEPPRMLEHQAGKYCFAVGISIQVTHTGGGFEREWITKWDVSEPTSIEAAKGGFSGAMKRAGAQWGIGRYLYRLDEEFAEVSLDSNLQRKGWQYAKLSQQHGGDVYFWKPPKLPAWALPDDDALTADDEPEPVTINQLNALKKAWRKTLAPDVKVKQDLIEGFERFVSSVVGSFPLNDPDCWSHDALGKCHERLQQDNGVDGVDDDVPFK